MRPMLRRPFSALAMVGAVCMVAPVVWAQPASGPAADGPAPEREVRAWLLRIHEAATHRNFQGTFVVSGGGAVSSARIAHFCEGPNQFERSESLDGFSAQRHVAGSDIRTVTAFPALDSSAILPRRSDGECGGDRQSASKGEFEHDSAH